MCLVNAYNLLTRWRLHPKHSHLPKYFDCLINCSSCILESFLLWYLNLDSKWLLLRNLTRLFGSAQPTRTYIPTTTKQPTYSFPEVSSLLFSRYASLPPLGRLSCPSRYISKSLSLQQVPIAWGRSKGLPPTDYFVTSAVRWLESFG
jgi:hypothetical protein